MVRRVVLWTAPRCVSCAFERSIRTLNNSKVFSEPFSNPYYFGPEKQIVRFASLPVDPDATYEATVKMLLAHYPGKELVFSKDMAYTIEGRFSDVFSRGLDNFTHTFLIRRPERSVYSLYKKSTKLSNSYGDFDPKEAGFHELYDLYGYVRSKMGYTPVVVDADDLLDDPEGMMKAYCTAIGIQYEENMTTWEPGPVPDWSESPWAMEWYSEVMQSSGFIRRSKIAAPTLPQDIPNVVSKCILECQPLYEALHCVRLLPSLELTSSS